MKDSSSDEPTQSIGQAYHRNFILARTIADLVGSEEIKSVDLEEGLQHFPKLILS